VYAETAFGCEPLENPIVIVCDKVAQRPPEIFEEPLAFMSAVDDATRNNG
jgi:hypothetical protein